MRDTYREQLLASVEEMEREQFRAKLRTMPDEEINNAICDSLGVPRGTVFTDQQLEMLIESHQQRKG